MISREHLDELIADEMPQITGAALERFNQYRIEPQTHPCIRQKDYGREPIYVIARRDRSFILFDDVEEYFGVGTAEPDGILRKWSIYDSLRTCINCFPDEKYAPFENV